MSSPAGIRGNRSAFEAAVLERAEQLAPQARLALADMLEALRTEALRNAAASHRKAKWMQFAYWRVVAVYAGHFRRLTRRAGRPVTSAVSLGDALGHRGAPPRRASGPRRPESARLAIGKDDATVEGQEVTQ